jgi:hypothetical protein
MVETEYIATSLLSSWDTAIADALLLIVVCNVSWALEEEFDLLGGPPPITQP